MRLWTVHPQYLDPSGLVAAWREGLLAQKVLEGKTKGYRHHPQLIRFQAHPEPLRCLGYFLSEIRLEAERRKYRFDGTKILFSEPVQPIEETSGQLKFEWDHLMQKLRARSPELAQKWQPVLKPEAHPLFHIIPGERRDWEKA